MTNILSVGNTCLDIILRHTDRLPKWSTEIFFKETQWRLGGQGANFAITCALLGYPTHLITNVGSDRVGARLDSELRTVRLLNNRFLQTTPGETGFTMSAVRSDGERFFLTFLGHQKSFSTKPQMPQIIDTVDKGDIVHISGYYMLPRLKAELPQLLRRLRERGTKVSYDPGWPPLGFAKSERKDLRAILAQVDFFEPNEAELLAMTGKTTILSAVNAIRHSFLGVIALKRGAKGSMIFSGRKQIVVEAFRVHPSNTTGAGDVFDAGFITGLVRNNSLDACARRGNAAAAIMMSKDKSDISRFPSKTTLDRLLKIR